MEGEGETPQRPCLLASAEEKLNSDSHQISADIRKLINVAELQALFDTTKDFGDKDSTRLYINQLK